MISIVIPAHNEGAVIGRLLTALTAGALPNEIEVIVVCNGCTDETAAVAAAFGAPVQVVETPIANKSKALNIGDELASAFPRLYIDADVVVSMGTIRALTDRLARGAILAVAPQPHFDVSSSSWAVRTFYDIRCRLPSFHEGIGGSGVYVLSELGRRRFDTFPNIVADDMYIRLQFTPDERDTLTSARSIVFAPHSLRQLIKIETRADFGTFQLAAQYPGRWANRGQTNYTILKRLSLSPSLWPGLAIYSYVRIVARLKATMSLHANTFVWERDDTSRTPRKSVRAIRASSPRKKCESDFDF